MSRIREIYKGLVQGTEYMDELSKETENEIAELFAECGLNFQNVNVKS